MVEDASPDEACEASLIHVADRLLSFFLPILFLFPTFFPRV